MAMFCPPDPLAGYFPNENDETMNEYKGFKVGDKVEIRKYMANWSSALGGSSPANAEYPLIGNIRNIGGSSIGQFGHVAVNIEGYGFNLDNLIITDNIKKLPKFSVGDKVRRHNLMAKLCTITKVFPDCSYTVNDCGDLQFKESDLVPFDGYRTGDEVWTLKRGKGIYCGECGGANSGRAWVRYNGVDWHPKLSNLLTEAEYKYKKGFIAKTISCKIDFGGFEKAAKTLREFGEITRKINELKLPSGGVTEKHDWLFNPMVGCSRIIGIKPQPKFKSGDVVYYHENDGRLTTTKWEVSHYSDEMVMIRQMSCGIDYRAKVRESDLRLWKEAEFKTRYYIGVTVTGMKPNDYSKVTFLGVCPHTGKDVLCGHLEKGMVDIFHGTRGDE